MHDLRANSPEVLLKKGEEIMVDFVQPSFQMLFVSLALFLLMFIMANPYKVFVNPKLAAKRIPTWQFSFFFLIYALYIIFAFNSSDFYSYWNEFIYAGQFKNYETQGYEQIYNWFADVTGDYIVWRSVIWGLGFLLYYFTAKKLDLQTKLLLLAIVFFGFSGRYTRGMLGHTMLLFGAVLLVDRKSNVATKVIGLALFCVSYFFHKSMYVNIAFALLAFYPLGKKSFVVSLIAFPFLTTVATMLIDGIVSGALDMSLGEGVGGVGDRTVLYASSEKMEWSIFGDIGRVISYLPEYLTLFYLANRVLYKGYFKGIKREKVFTYLFRLTYVAIYIASLFAFVETSDWIYLRFKYMAFFPLPFVLAKVWSLEPKSNSWVKWIILLQAFALFFSWFMDIKTWYEL